MCKAIKYKQIWDEQISERVPGKCESLLNYRIHSTLQHTYKEITRKHMPSDNINPILGGPQIQLISGGWGYFYLKLELHTVGTMMDPKNLGIYLTNKKGIRSRAQKLGPWREFLNDR